MRMNYFVLPVGVCNVKAITFYMFKEVLQLYFIFFGGHMHIDHSGQHDFPEAACTIRSSKFQGHFTIEIEGLMNQGS